jgi:hypothetical protein
MKNLMRKLCGMRWQRPLSLLALLLFAGLPPAAYGGDEPDGPSGGESRDDEDGDGDGDGGGDTMSGGDETIGTLPSRHRRGGPAGPQLPWQDILTDGRSLTIEGSNLAFANALASVRADSIEVYALANGRQRMTLRGNFELAFRADPLSASDLSITLESMVTARIDVSWRQRVVSGLSLSPARALELPLAALGRTAGGLSITSVDDFGMGSNLSVQAGRERLFLTQRQRQVH